MQKSNVAPIDVFVPEFPIKCSGSFCHQRNIHAGPGKLCPECNWAKRRHNKSERSRWWNRERANRRRQLLHLDRALIRRNEQGGVRPRHLTALNVFCRLTGMRMLGAYATYW